MIRRLICLFDLPTAIFLLDGRYLGQILGDSSLQRQAERDSFKQQLDESDKSGLTALEKTAMQRRICSPTDPAKDLGDRVGGQEGCGQPPSEAVPTSRAGHQGQGRGSIATSMSEWLQSPKKARYIALDAGNASLSRWRW